MKNYNFTLIILTIFVYIRFYIFLSDYFLLNFENFSFVINGDFNNIIIAYGFKISQIKNIN